MIQTQSQNNEIRQIDDKVWHKVKYYVRTEVRSEVKVKVMCEVWDEAWWKVRDKAWRKLFP